MDSLRLFIAIELDDSLRHELKRIENHLQDERAMKNVRWVAPQNIHLTIKFLGNAERVRVPPLSTVLENEAKHITPFALTARGVGCFPNVRRPNNLWVGLEGDIKAAALLARKLDDACAPLGFARDERGFTPHLTLGRVKREATPSERAAIGDALKNLSVGTVGTIRADAISLIASDLRPGGPVYSRLASLSFRGEPGEQTE